MIELPTATEPVRVIEGECFEALRLLPERAFDALVTDPPYSSGGLHATARAADPRTKYCQDNKDLGRPSFEGDCRDQRSWAWWCSTWLTAARRRVKRGGYCLVFIDWRQLPAMTDAVQAAGWTWRGIVPWDKGGGARAPHKGYFRHQCEYVVWATNGPIEVPTVTDPRGGPWPGCFQFGVRQADKHHMTGKPTDLMRALVKVVQPDGLVLDPFAGSGTTGVACALEGRRCVLVEQEPEYASVCRARVAKAVGSCPVVEECDARLDVPALGGGRGVDRARHAARRRARLRSEGGVRDHAGGPPVGRGR